MTLFTLSSILMISSMIFMQMNHPLAMGLMLLLQTLLVSLMSGMLTQSFWFSYILFIVFLGGMLVLFIYVTSLASNEMFSMSMKLVFMSLTTMIMLISIMMIMDKTMLYMNAENLEMMNLSEQKSMIPENTINLAKLYNFPTNMITIMLVSYLLITLIAAVKITNSFTGPLRHSN